MKIKLLDLIILLIMFFSLAVATILYFQNHFQECTSNPLVYSAKLYEENYPVQAIGTLTLIPLEPNKKTIMINFNSKNFSVLD